MFAWTHLGSAITDNPPTVYRLGSTEVARLWQTVGRAWFATLDMHLPHEQRPRPRPCQGYETGRAGVEAWAERHRERLMREVAGIDAKRPCRAWMPAGQKDAPR
ncbi:MAG TPA: hypothetical protein VGD21_09135 [Lysobacter sp.]